MILTVALGASRLPVTDLVQLRAWAYSTGAAAPLIFAAGFAVVALAPVPRSALSAAAGALFGLGVGSVVAFAGAIASAVAAFALARLLGRPLVERSAGSRVARIDHLLQRRGVTAVIAARLTPIAPFTAVNYGSGICAVRFRDFLLGTVVGVLPGTLVYVSLGALGTSASPASKITTAAIMMVGIGVVLHLFLRHRADARH